MILWEIANMTRLEKQVSRKTKFTYKVLYNQPREIIVSLTPGDVIEFREAGRKQRFSVEIHRVFSYAVRLHAESERSKKKAIKIAKKKGTYEGK